MTKEELAKILTGRQYLSELSKEESKIAKENNLVVALGRSDDLLELYGAIDDEIDAWEGTSIRVNKEGLVSLKKCSDPDCPCYNQPKTGSEINMIWAPSSPEGCSWIFKTKIPHAVFDIMEDDMLYCKGIVFSLDEVDL